MYVCMYVCMYEHGMGAASKGMYVCIGNVGNQSAECVFVKCSSAATKH